MGYELINRITVKKDGVYISSHSSNDDCPYRSHRIDFLSKIYADEGQKGLDREIICMLLDYAMLRGNHKSVERYRKVLYSVQAKRAQEKYVDILNSVYVKLSDADKKSIWGCEPTEKAKEYLVFREEKRKIMLEEVAALCESK